MQAIRSNHRRGAIAQRLSLQILNRTMAISISYILYIVNFKKKIINGEHDNHLIIYNLKATFQEIVCVLQNLDSYNSNDRNEVHDLTKI